VQQERQAETRAAPNTVPPAVNDGYLKRCAAIKMLAVKEVLHMVVSPVAFSVKTFL
jgi:hypothetical protein